ncbi:flavin reductase like domain-containing protein [Spinellus fusiger]|nr:flavin reductase like domain-containing protein [Spinellus fusiger]
MPLHGLLLLLARNFKSKRLFNHLPFIRTHQLTTKNHTTPTTTNAGNITSKQDLIATSLPHVNDQVRTIMRTIPQPVVTVTTSLPGDPTQRRGITVSSFTSICLEPEPLVSFAVRIPSRASELLHSSGSMVVNVLSHEQVQQSIRFSSPSEDQFKGIPFYDDSTTGLPVLMGTLGSMHCKMRDVLTLGDHELWIVRVIKVDHGVGSVKGKREEARPLLYHDRQYRSIGEQVFMKEFESSLDRKHWTHRAHIRMAWNYLRELGPEEASPVIKRTIRAHFEKNTQGHKYNDTMSSFYIHLVGLAVKEDGGKDDFFSFIENYPVVTDQSKIMEYYSPSLIASDTARHQFVAPDKKSLPSQLSDLTL